MPKKLFIFRPSMTVGGADRVTLILLEQLSRERFDTTLVLMRAEGELLSRIPDHVIVRDLEARSLWTAWIPLARLLWKTPPDILFSTSSGGNVAAVVAALLTRKVGRLVLSERGGLRTDLSWKKKVLLILKKILYRRVDRITTVSEGIKNELTARLNLPPDSISVVYNPIVSAELEKLRKAPVTHPWFDAARDTSPLVVLTAGRLVEEKDHANLVRAFARVSQDHNARLMILGEGGLRGEIEALVEKLQLEGVVALPGFDPNPFKYMARSAVFALSSRFEGLPGALIQAMACGLPVVSTDCPSGPSELIEDQKNGLLVPVGDNRALARALSKLLADEGLRRTLGQEARRSVQRFHVDSILPNYETALLGSARR